MIKLIIGNNIQNYKQCNHCHTVMSLQYRGYE